MNQSAAAAGNSTASILADATALLTTVHLAWLVVLALLVIAGIVYGARLKRQRTIAARRVERHIEQAGVERQPAAGEAVTVPPAEPSPSPSPPPEREAAGGPVSQLKGLGPKVAARLAELGITSVGQIAALDHDEAQAVDAQLGPFRGRIERDRWVEQARFLAAGDRAGFEAVFGKL